MYVDTLQTEWRPNKVEFESRTKPSAKRRGETRMRFVYQKIISGLCVCSSSSLVYKFAAAFSLKKTNKSSGAWLNRRVSQ